MLEAPNLVLRCSRTVVQSVKDKPLSSTCSGNCGRRLFTPNLSFPVRQPYQDEAHDKKDIRRTRILPIERNTRQIAPGA